MGPTLLTIDRRNSCCRGMRRTAKGLGTSLNGFGGLGGIRPRKAHSRLPGAVGATRVRQGIGRCGSRSMVAFRITVHISSAGMERSSLG